MTQVLLVAARSTGKFNKDTAIICSRVKSAQVNLPQKGDKLRDNHCAGISAALTGKPKSEEHKSAISAASKGQSKAAWTPERKAARRQQIAERKAAKQAADAGQVKKPNA